MSVMERSTTKNEMPTRPLAVLAKRLRRPVRVKASVGHPAIAHAERRLGNADRLPSFSVIIPCYNYARFLGESITSALRQSGVDVEVIVVDDASTDDSVAVVQRFQRNSPNVRLVRSGSNSGHVIAFNRGYAEATGEYIVRLDADDLLTPGSLERSASVLETFPSVGLVYGRPIHFENRAPTAARVGPVTWTIWGGRDWIAERCRVAVNCITTPEAAVRASVLRQIGALNTTLRFAQDMEMWMRTASVADVAWIEGADQAFHRDHDSSMSATTGAGALIDLYERLKVFDVLFDGPGGLLDDAVGLKSLARRNLAREALVRACHAYDRGRAGREPVDEFVVFAKVSWPEYRHLKEYRALGRRRRVGPKWSPAMPTFIAAVALRRLGSEFARARWLTTGL